MLGFDYASSRFRSRALPAASGMPGGHGNTQFWRLADQMLVRNGSGAHDGVVALGGVVVTNADNSAYAQQYFSDLLDQGCWRARPKDTIELLFTCFAMSGTLGKVQTEEAELSVPFINTATEVQTHEIEAYCNIHVYRGVGFWPDFQYVIWPDTQANMRHRGRSWVRALCGVLTARLLDNTDAYLWTQREEPDYGRSHYGRTNLW